MSLAGCQTKSIGAVRFKLPESSNGYTFQKINMSEQQNSSVLFQDVSQSSGINYSGLTFGSAWGDVNGDDWTDLWVNNHFNNAGILYINQKDGTFLDQTSDVFNLGDLVSDMHGAAWADFDRDGDQDLIQLAGGGPPGGPPDLNNRLFINNGGSLESGTSLPLSLVDRAPELGVENWLFKGTTPLWFDFNNDGLLDLLVNARAREEADPTLFLQTSSGQFESANSLLNFNETASTTALVSDFSGDGKFELAIDGVKKVYDQSSSSLQDIASSLFPNRIQSSDSSAADFNGDLIPDIYLTRGGNAGEDLAVIDEKQLRARVSVRGGEEGFTFKSLGELILSIDRPPETIFIGQNGFNPPGRNNFSISSDDPATHGMPSYIPGETRGIFIGFDDEASEWKVTVSSPSSYVLPIVVNSQVPITDVTPIGGFSPGSSPTSEKLFLSNANGSFSDATASSGINSSPVAGISSVYGDFDNDMDVDIYVVATGSAANDDNVFWENQGDGSFVKAVGFGAEGSSLGRGDTVTTADYDQDGFLDLFVVNGVAPDPLFSLDGPHQLFRNQGNDNHWIQIDLEGVLSNKDGIGASVIVKTGGVSQLREQAGGIHRYSQDSKRLHFGLAANTVVDEIEIRWPSGIVQTVQNVDVNQIIKVVEDGGTPTFGTEERDFLVGTAANESFVGLGGDDSIRGRGGDDFIRGDAGDDNLLGQFGDDIIDGGLGNDQIIGGQGVDRLTGGSGSDVFMFQSPKEGGDVITDFTSGEDTFKIKAVNFKSGLRQGSLSDDRFVLGNVANDADDRFLYDQSTGQFFFDSDGSGDISPILLATLSNRPNLTAQDITILGNAPNTVPEIGNDFAATTIEIPVSIDVLSNDTDADGDLLAISLSNVPTNGSAVVDDSGTPTDSTDDSIIYTPDSGFVGVDQFSYSVSDGRGGTDTGLVEIVVTDPTAPAPPLFEEATQFSGIDRIGQSWGVFWSDFDGDGFADIWMPDHFDQGTLYRNQGDGTFSEITADVFSVEELIEDTHSALWADFDNDGDQDLLQAVGAQAGSGSGPTQLFVNNNGRLENQAISLGVDYPLGRGRSVLWMDVDNNGLLDIVTAVRTRPDNAAPPTIFLQTDEGFTNAGAGLEFSPRNRQSEPYALFSDLDRDGTPELVYKDGNPPLVVYGSQTSPLVDKTDLLPALQNSVYGLNSDIAIADFNGDLRPDIYFGQNGIESDIGQQSDTIIKMAVVSRASETIEKGISFNTSGDLSFTLGPQPFGKQGVFIGASGMNPNSGVAFTLSSNDPNVEGMPAYTVGIDRGVFMGYNSNSQEWEIVVLGPTRGTFAAHIESTETISALTSFNFESTSTSQPDSLLYGTESGFDDISAVSGINSIENASNSVVAGDFDNDMDVDLYVLASGPSTNLPNLYYENQGDGTFAVVENGNGASGTALGVGDAAAAADYDNDGFLDLVVTNGKWVPPGGEGSPADIAPVQLFKNQGNNNRWIQIELEGTVSNRDGLGAQVYVTAGGITQLREQTGGAHNRAQDFKRLHFGLGTHETVDKIEIHWSSGRVQEITSLDTNQIISITEGSITGTDAAEKIDGTADDDTIYGYAGADRIVSGNGNDYLIGGDGDDFLVANGGDDLLEGGSGSDLLVGGQGNDILTGGSGSDIFRIQSPTEALDTITDFAPTEDVIQIKQFKFLSGLMKGTLSADRLELGTASTKADTRFVYDQAKGNLFFDSDGNDSGEQTLIANFSNQSTLSNSHIVVI